MPGQQMQTDLRLEKARELVPAQLQLIISSGVFGRAESLVRLLRYLVAEALAGRSERLKEYTLGCEVFGRGEDFDPRVDTIARTQVRRLRSKLQEYYSEQGKTDEITIDIPRGTYVPVFARRSGPAKLARVAARRARIIPRFAIAAGVLALIAAVALQPPRAKTSAARSVAVLPFADLTGDGTHRSLSDAISEQLSQALGRNSAIRIASRTSTLQYKDVGADVRKLGAILRVGAIVEGSVQATGDRLRITAHLVKTNDGYRLWSKSWQGNAAELSRVPEEAARGIMGALGLSVGAGDQMLRDPDVYRFYLKGRLGRDNRAFAYLDEALRRDPRFSPAWLGKAELYLEQAQHAAAPPSIVLPRAREAALRALETGEDVAAAHVVLARVATVYDWDWDEAEKQYQRALELDPDAEFIHLQYALLIIARGRTTEALEEMQRVRRVGAPAARFASGEAAIYYFARQHDRVIDHCQAVLDAAPDDFSCHFWMGRAYLAKGMPQEAVAAFGKVDRAGSMGFGSPITAYVAAGRRADALRLRADAERQVAAHAYVSPVSLAQMHFAFGEKDAGFRDLDRALQVRDQSLAGLKVEPIYDMVRSDPRFKRILRRLNL